jgi:UDP-2,3-diacylglucosamine pyrophosphatase LpxH
MAPIDLETRWRSLFISDVHLGTRGCRASILADFLARTHADNIFLLGDIVDLERAGYQPYWPRAHGAIVEALSARAAAGTRVVFVPGNHDEALRSLCGLRIGHVEVARSLEHVTAAGERLLLTHGDEFDVRHAYGPAVARLAEFLYDGLLRLSVAVHAGRRWAGLPYWSLITAAKWQLSAVRRAVSRYEDNAARAAAEAGFDGIVCGHIHRPANQRLHGVRYINTGDWVEHCTALIEHQDGRLELLDLAHPRRELRTRNTAAPAPVAA